MPVIYILLVIWMGIFIFASYYAIVEGNKAGILATGLSLFIIFVLLFAAKLSQ